MRETTEGRFTPGGAGRWDDASVEIGLGMARTYTRLSTPPAGPETKEPNSMIYLAYVTGLLVLGLGLIRGVGRRARLITRSALIGLGS